MPDSDTREENYPRSEATIDGLYNSGPSYSEDIFLNAENSQIRGRHRSRFLSPSQPKIIFNTLLYDATDPARKCTSLSSKKAVTPEVKTIPETKEKGISRESLLDLQHTMKAQMEQALEQRIDVVSVTRESRFHTAIYVYSTIPAGHLSIEQLKAMFTKAPITKRETNETEKDKHRTNLKEEIFVQNNAIKIKRLALFRDLQDGKEDIMNDCLTYSNLCPAEVTSAVQREIYGNVTLRPQSTLNLISAYDGRRCLNGNIRLVENLTIILSSGKEPQPTRNLQHNVEERIVKPKNYKLPVRYAEKVLLGPYRIDISRDAEIGPSEGLSKFMAVGGQQIFEFAEIRRYDCDALLAYICLAPRKTPYNQEQFKKSLLTESCRDASEIATVRSFSPTSSSPGYITKNKAPLPSANSSFKASGGITKDSTIARSIPVASLHSSPKRPWFFGTRPNYTTILRPQLQSSGEILHFKRRVPGQLLYRYQSQSSKPSDKKLKGKMMTTL
uniref:Uncharacterized protein n=1 Tax=Setaria digitata TaxID=48799 RepID=A0A915PYP9_9BILA